MTQNPKKPKQPQNEPNYDTIKQWLIKNPEYFCDICTLIGEHSPPRFNTETNIIDMQQVALHRMRKEISHKQSREKQLLRAAKENILSQGRIHKAVLCVLEISSLKSLLSFVSRDLPNILNVRTVILKLDSTVKVPKLKNRVILQSGVTWPREFFENNAENIGSCACLRLKYGTDRKKNAFLLLGATEPDAFHPSQGTDLLNFFADVLEISLSQWI